MMAASPPVVMALLNSAVQHRAEGGEVEEVEMEGGADPETDAGHDHLLPVWLVLDHRPSAVHQQRAGYQHQVSGHDRGGYGGDQPRHLWQERRRDKDEGDEVADPPRSNAGGLGKGDDSRIDDVGHCAAEAGQQVADTGAHHPSLHLAEVHGPVIAPRHTLLGDGLAVGVDGENDGQEEEGGQQRPEGNAEPGCKVGQVGRQARPRETRPPGRCRRFRTRRRRCSRPRCR